MILLIFLLIGAVCAILCVASLLVWLTAAAVQGFADCAAKSLANLTDRRAIVGLLYLIPAGLLLYAIGDGLCLAWSFCAAVFK
jgi:hypothetical protein